MSSEKTYSIELTEAQWNVVLQGVAQLPYANVAPVIHNMQKQFSELAAANDVAEEKEE